MAITLPKNLSGTAIDKPKGGIQGPKVLSQQEKRDHLAAKAELHAEALRKSWDKTQRKAKGLNRLWYKVSGSGVSISCKWGQAPIIFIKGMTEAKPWYFVDDSETAAGVYEAIAKGAKAGDLDSEIEAAIVASKKIAAKRK